MPWPFSKVHQAEPLARQHMLTSWKRSFPCVDTGPTLAGTFRMHTTPPPCAPHSSPQQPQPFTRLWRQSTRTGRQPLGSLPHARTPQKTTPPNSLAREHAPARFPGLTESLDPRLCDCRPCSPSSCPASKPRPLRPPRAALLMLRRDPGPAPAGSEPAAAEASLELPPVLDSPSGRAKIYAWACFRGNSLGDRCEIDGLLVGAGVAVLSIR